MQSLPLTPARQLLLLALLCCSCGEGGSPANWLTGPTVDTHARFLPLTGTVHASIDCATCHAGDTFTQFDCLSCHTADKTDPLHATVTGYQWSSASCYGCHPTGGPGAPANHDSAFFPRGTGTKHAAVNCTDCHSDLTQPGNASAFKCGSCHLSRDAALVTKHTSPASNALRVQASEISTGDSATCLRCHADSQLVTSHPGGGNGFPPHEGARCLQCHDGARTDKAFGIDFASNPADAAKLAGRHGCYTCHDTAPPRGG